MTRWQKVSKEEYYEFIEAYPNKVTCYILCDEETFPEQLRHDDFTENKRPPFSFLGKVIMNENYPELKRNNEYYLNDFQR